MSVTTTSIGPNSKQIEIIDETRVAPIISAIDSAITSLGWTLHDTVVSGVRNCMTTKVYSAPNIDDPTSPTTKYVILRFDAPKALFYMTCAEYWNNTTHVATNESHDFERAYPMTLQTSNEAIYVFATARYMVIQTKFLGELGVWQGVFEWERNPLIPEDTAATGAPCFGYTNGLIFADVNQTVTSTTAGPSNSMVPPRTLDGYTGWGAAKTFGLKTSRGEFPCNIAQRPENTTGSITIDSLFNQTYYKFIDSSKYPVINPSLSSKFETYIDTGRIYGLHIIKPTGGGLDTVDIPIDNNGFYDSTGTTTTHYTFATGGGNSYHFNLTSGDIKIEYALPGHADTPELTYGVIVRGKYLFTSEARTGANALYKFDLISKLWTKIPYTNDTGLFYIQDMIFDGEDHIYISRSTKATSTSVSYVSKFNIDTSTFQEYPVFVNGCGALAVTDTKLYVAANNPAKIVDSRPIVNAYNLSDTPSTATTAFTCQAPNATPWTSNSHMISNIETLDYSNSVVVFYIAHTTSFSSPAAGAVKAINFNSSGTVVSSISNANCYGATGYPLTPIVQYTNTGLAVKTRRKNTTTDYGYGAHLLLNPDTLAYAVSHANNSSPPNRATSGQHQTTQRNLNSHGSNAESGPYRPVIWKGRYWITPFLTQEYANFFGNYDHCQSLFAHTHYSNSRIYASPTSSEASSSVNVNDSFSYSRYYKFISDGTFLYMLGSLSGAGTISSNYVYSGQLSGKKNTGAYSPTILIKG